MDLFRRKKGEDDDDDLDDEFDEGLDIDDSGGEDAAGGGADNAASPDASAVSDDGSVDDLPAGVLSQDGDPSDDDKIGDENMPGIDEDIPDFEDDYGDEDEDESDEAGSGRFAVLLEKRWALFSLIGTGACVFLLVVGSGIWWLISDDEPDVAEKSRESNFSSTSMALPPALSPGALQPGASLNQLGAVGVTDVPVGEEADSTPSPTTENNVSEPTEAAPLNAALGASGGLNVALGATSPGSGLIVPVATVSNYSQFPDALPGEALSRAPDTDLIEVRNGDVRPLPRVSSDGRLPWQVYARPSEPKPGMPRVAVLVTGLGLSKAETLAAIRKLPPEITLSFSPYAEELDQWMIRSRRAGHEVMLGMPLESNRFPIEDQGPLALLSGLSLDENIERLNSLMSLLQGSIGMEVVMGSKYTTNKPAIYDMLNALNARGLAVVEGSWNNRSLIPKVAEELAMPRAVSDILLDEVRARAAIEVKLKELDSIVQTRKKALATMGMSPAGVEMLLVWIDSLLDKGVQLVPLSAMITMQPAPES